MGREILAVLSGFLWSLGAYGIVGPIQTPIPDNHPGSYNTVALVKPKPGGKYGIFCSGFIFNQSTVVTAKHCVANRETSEVLVYLGNDTTNVDQSLLIPIQNKEVFGSSDWENYFPSFDVGVVKLQKPIPNFGDKKSKPYFDSVPFLGDPSYLETAETIHLVGYGNQSTETGVIVAGEKKHVATGFHRFLDTPQLSSLIVFRGKIGHSNCHGDSGGPAYAYLENPRTGIKQWYVVGTTAGFDLALTPGSYVERDDEDFPFIAKCDQAQTIYSYIGDYLPWIEKLAEQQGQGTLGEVRELLPGEFRVAPNKAKDFRWYCENITWDDKRWGAVRDLMIVATEMEHEHSTDDVFANCALASQVLENLTTVSFDEHSFIDSLEPLSSLPNLKKISVSKRALPDLRGLDSASLESLHLNEVSGIEDLSWLTSFPSAIRLKSLWVRNSNIKESIGLEATVNLIDLNLERNYLSDLQQLSSLNKLKSLTVNNNDLKDLKHLPSDSQLTHLVVFANQLTDLPRLRHLRVLHAKSNQLTEIQSLRESVNLSEVNLASNQLTDISYLGDLESIVKMDLSANKIKGSGLAGKWLTSVKELRVNQTQIDDLSFVARSFQLEKLYASQTQVKDLSPIIDLTKLKTLFLGETPISAGHGVSEATCPTQGKNAVAKYCQRLSGKSDLDPSVSWRFE